MESFRVHLPNVQRLSKEKDTIITAKYPTCDFFDESHVVLRQTLVNNCIETGGTYTSRHHSQHSRRKSTLIILQRNNANHETDENPQR